MPRYFFHLRDSETLHDAIGTELKDAGAAQVHAESVAKEITFRSSGLFGHSWETWTLSVQDSDGNEVFTMPLHDPGKDTNGGN